MVEKMELRQIMVQRIPDPVKWNLTYGQASAIFQIMNMPELQVTVVKDLNYAVKMKEEFSKASTFESFLAINKIELI